MHAVADAPEGPFAAREVVVPVFAHNPQVVRASDGTYLLFHIGGTQLASARTLDGPWTPVAGLPSCNNPSPVALPNGTLFVVCHGGPHPNHWGISVELMYADSWRGPWSTFRGNAADGYDGGTALFSHPVEDPFLWTTNGSWHMLTHGFRMPMVSQSSALGAYAWAPSPFGPWTFQENRLVYSANVTLADGSTYVLARRERPKVTTIMINEKKKKKKRKKKDGEWNNEPCPFLRRRAVIVSSPAFCYCLLLASLLD